jgi:hypothetical protein
MTQEELEKPLIWLLASDTPYFSLILGIYQRERNILCEEFEEYPRATHDLDGLVSIVELKMQIPERKPIVWMG